MENKTIEINIKELISKFENGQNRYINSAATQAAIDIIARGGDPIAIIDQLIRSNDAEAERIKELIENGGLKTTMQLTKSESVTAMMDQLKTKRGLIGELETKVRGLSIVFIVSCVFILCQAIGFSWYILTH